MGSTYKYAYSVFESSIGSLAIAWTVKGIVAVQLAEENLEQTVSALKRRFNEIAIAEAPETVADAISLIQKHLDGELQDLCSVPLDYSNCSAFSKKVYEAARQVRAGALVSYSEIACAIEAPGSARAVGRALGANPFPLIVPCHRVLGKDGSMTGFSAYGGCNTKLRLLSIERALGSDRLVLADIS